MDFTVLSPWAKSDYLEKKPINPRLDKIQGKTLGLYSSFKEYHPAFAKEIERQIDELYPGTLFSHFTYLIDTCEIQNDPQNYPNFKQWLSGVDAVIGVGADFGSCSLFMGYIFAEIERLGKPAVLLTKCQYESAARKGATARGYPGLRLVTYDGPNTLPAEVDCEKWTIECYRDTIAEMLPDIVTAITSPLNDVESAPPAAKDWSSVTFTGSLDEINDYFYSNGWTNGAPVLPPTEEAVLEMLKGTDLPRDHIVAELPPMLGKATVEKIAINGIMAGCLPIYMPLLIAIAEGMADDIIKLEGWTSSVASWAPTIVISGPIRDVIGINSDRSLFSPYTKPSACIAKAMAYMIMNISGSRLKNEDMSGVGNDCRFGICIAENEEESPWLPLQTDYGFESVDSCVTLFWPSERYMVTTASPRDCLEKLCNLQHFGFDAGMMLTLPPECAKLFADKGYSKKDILDYVKEYNRRPSSEIPRAAIGNNHPREGLIYPEGGLVHSAPLFWNTSHMFVLVGGRDSGTAYLGGGDHGGPVCKKANLPKNWDVLVEQYGYKKPQYVEY